MRSGVVVRSLGIATTLVVAAVAAPPLRAQSIAERAGGGTRTIAFAAASRADVCGDGKNFLSDGLGAGRRIYEGYIIGTTDMATLACVHGPVRVVVRIVDGRPTRLRTLAGPLSALGDTVQDLGVVPTADAFAYLRDVARNGDGRASEEALLPVALIDSIPRWDILAAAARDSTRLLRYRRRATDLLARGAARAVGAMPSDEDPAVAERRAAVRALAMRRNRDDDVVPSLIEIARANKHPDARAEALYQLGHIADARAVELFASLLGVRQ